jgi:hypothetical protein
MTSRRAQSGLPWTVVPSNAHCACCESEALRLGERCSLDLNKFKTHYAFGEQCCYVINMVSEKCCL